MRNKYIDISTHKDLVKTVRVVCLLVLFLAIFFDTEVSHTSVPSDIETFESALQVSTEYEPGTKLWKQNIIKVLQK